MDERSSSMNLRKNHDIHDRGHRGEVKPKLPNQEMSRNARMRGLAGLCLRFLEDEAVAEKKVHDRARGNSENVGEKVIDVRDAYECVHEHDISQD